MAETCSVCGATATGRCVNCQTGICEEHTRIGQPLITARQLVSATVTTAVRAPGLLNEVLFKELDKVPYCPTCREVIAGRRQTEQLKVLGGLLLVLLLVIGIPLLLALT